MFQKKLPYSEDQYEHKEDDKRNDYIENRSRILQPERPYTSTVRQRGTFYGPKITFGTDRDFPDVINIYFNQLCFRNLETLPDLLLMDLLRDLICLIRVTIRQLELT